MATALRPGTKVSLRSTPSVVSLPTDTGVAFMVGLTDRGPLTPTLIRSLNDFINVYGARQSYSVLYDAVELFFTEGGNAAYIERVVGPSATSGTHNLLDGVSATSLVVTGIGPGAWSANYKVSVVAGIGSGTYQINVTDTNNVVLENSGDLADQNSAVQWSKNSNYVRITLGAAADNPVVAAGAALSAGNDDRGNITDTQWLNALNAFTSDLGPGQVSAPGRTSTTGQQQLITHAEANNRVALIDLQDSNVAATLEGAVAALTDSRFAAAFAPWVQIPGITGIGTFRTVPASALVAGLIARNDPSLGANRPSAGNAGISRFSTGLSQPSWDQTTRDALNTSGVNVVRSMFGGIRVYGWRSLTSPVTDADWLDFGNGRLYMAIVAQLEVAGENYTFDEIDGQNGETIGNFHTALAGVCMSFYNSRQLFGDTADEAFSVDTGTGVNTLTTIANQELHGVVAVRMATMAELVVIEIVKTPITESV